MGLGEGEATARRSWAVLGSLGLVDGSGCGGTIDAMLPRSGTWLLTCSGSCPFREVVTGTAADMHAAVMQHAACPWPTDVVDLRSGSPRQRSGKRGGVGRRGVSQTPHP